MRTVFVFTYLSSEKEQVWHHLGKSPEIQISRGGRLTSYLDTILFTENSVRTFHRKGPSTLGPPQICQ